MIRKTKKNRHFHDIEIYEVKWFPNAKSCISSTSRRVKPNLLPPLMVRKADWRR
ncbi:MAG: hypothetical protein ACYTBP_03595 [Planctomycetota bacterium]